MFKFQKKLILLFLSISFSLVFIACDGYKFSTTTETTTITTSSSNTSETVSPNTNVGIMVSDITKTIYEQGKPLDHSTFTVYLEKASGSLIPLGSTVYQVSGFDSSTPGDQLVTISYLTFTATFLVEVIEVTTDLVISMEYYLSAQNLTGQALLDELHDIINTGFNGVDYGDARYMLDDTDRDPNNASKVILLYLGTSVNGAWDGGVTWNREHVWPQSLLGESAENSTVNMASDLHNLKPADPNTNSSRGNKYFSNTTTADTYAPRDEVKGDIARILLYMVVMYDVLELVDVYPDVHEMALLSVLLQWHDLDPVDDFERNRNNVIYSYQYNRNPFIDYPEFVDLIWNHL